MEQRIEAFIKEWLQGNSGLDCDIDNDDNFFDILILDNFDIFELIGDLEAEFGVDLDDVEFTDLNTINKIKNYIIENEG